jgi:hypothetical protein
MTTEPTSADAPAANADTAPAATSSNAQAATDTETITLEEARRLRSEGQALRKRLKAFEDADQAAKDAQLSEKDRLEKQLADLQSKHDAAIQREKQSAISAEIHRQAAAAGVPANRLERAARLIDATEVTFENDKPTNVKDLVDALLKDVPELIGKAPPTSGGATNPSRAASGTAAQLSWDIITKMTPDQYAARGAEIRAWIADNPVRRR